MEPSQINVNHINIPDVVRYGDVDIWVEIVVYPCRNTPYGNFGLKCDRDAIVILKSPQINDIFA